MVMKGLKHYTAAELSSALGAFNPLCLIGEGGFGRVYRAMIDLTPVAVKVLDHGGLQGMDEFNNELHLLSALQHPHLVRLLGYCMEGATQCLVYELMAYGNLEDALACKDGAVPLSWQLRIKISAHMAAALAYLHTRTPVAIIHHDFKPANVFLDCDFNAKVGDVGLASAATAPPPAGRNPSEAVGTWSYLAPEYKSEGKVSPKTDVYAFGVSLLQLVTSENHPKGLVEKCRQALQEGDVARLVDRRAGAWDLQAAARLTKLGLWCCMERPEERPVMHVVHNELLRLWAVVHMQQQPSSGAS